MTSVMSLVLPVVQARWFFALLPLQCLGLLLQDAVRVLNTCEVLMRFDKQQHKSIACV